ncbi:hypothetical protein DMN91_005710 [Ooceraea biroi]|uniref:Uncharacterized protein n=1 Tax=Ooceraea biroi TaxID=2015173 RepID=A0A3L8DLQ8_OOCBI|nr:hypothetical protein DMN91_005710 [Ooceraea biroi]
MSLRFVLRNKFHQHSYRNPMGEKNRASFGSITGYGTKFAQQPSPFRLGNRENCASRFSLLLAHPMCCPDDLTRLARGINAESEPIRQPEARNACGHISLSLGWSRARTTCAPSCRADVAS